MAIYGDSFYGVDTYGAPRTVDFQVDPFTAVPQGYNTIRLNWVSPTGDWDEIRLLQSRTGFAVHENDGLILIDSTQAVAEYVDTDLLDGTWYYYTLVIHAEGQWNVAGTASAMSVGKTGMSDLMWDRIPRWFQHEPTNPAAASHTWEQTAEVIDPNSGWEVNQTLKDYAGVLGWGLDYLRSYQDTLLAANDTKQSHLANVFRLAQTLGEEWEPRAPAYLMRQKVQNAGVLAQQRGTIDGLRELIATSVGYDIDLSIGPNMFLNEDQSGFANPQFPEWDSATNWAANDVVTFIGGIWKCISGAYGVEQAPPNLAVIGASTGNTWWTLVTSETLEDVRDTNTGAVVTWKPYVGNTFKPADLAYGVSDPLDQLDNASNALWVRNQDATTQSYTVVGAANPLSADSATPAADVAVLHGIPLPRLLVWDKDTEYNDGDYVAFEGLSFAATRDSLGEQPGTSNAWTKIGFDERLPFKYSFWTHAGYTEVDNTTGTIPVSGSVLFYDGQGNLLSAPVVPSSVPVLDTFNTSLRDLLQHHAFDVEPSTLSWNVISGVWETVPLSAGESSVAWANTPGLALVSGPAQTSYHVAVTFGPAPINGTQALVVSAAADGSSYVAVERDAIRQYEHGAVTATAALSEPIQDGDRVSAVINSATATVSVYVNDSSSAAGTLTFTITHNNTYGMKIG